MERQNAEKVEVLKVWYSVFCTVIDGHIEGEFSDYEFIDKMLKLRRKLAESMPEVEEEMRRAKN